MKTSILTLIFFALTFTAVSAEDPIDKKLQQALFAEEGTRDLDKAIEAYNAVIAQYDTQRQYAATAVFRLAECYRKKGQKAQAIAAYQRLLSEFPGEETLVRMAGENLATLGADATAAGGAIAATSNSEAAEIARIKKLVAQSPDLLNDPSTGLLHEAAANSHLKVAEYLLDAGADVNLEAKSHQIQIPLSPSRTVPPILQAVHPTPVTVAAKAGHLAMVNFLISKGATPDPNTIHIAGTQNRNVILEVLLKHLPEGDQATLNRFLLVACRIARADFVGALLARGASPTPDPENGYASPLSVSIQQRDAGSVRLILAKGAVPSEDDLQMAIMYSEEIFDLIWATGVRSPEALGSVIHSDTEIALKIIEGTADIEAPNSEGVTPLGLACVLLRPEMVRAILEKGADPNRLTNHNGTPVFVGRTPLMAALSSSAFIGDPKGYEGALGDIVAQLIGAGADIELRNSGGTSALHYAALNSAPQRNRRTPKSQTGAWQQEMRYAPVSVVEKLLACSPSIDYADRRTSSIIRLAPIDSPEPALARIADYVWSRFPDRGSNVTLVTTDGYTNQLSTRPMRLSEALMRKSHLKGIASHNFDLSEVWVMRPGESKPTAINYIEIVASGDLESDPVLGLGSIVFVPNYKSLPEPGSYTTVGDELDFIERAAAKSVTVVRGEHRWQGSARPLHPDTSVVKHTYTPDSGIVYANNVNELLDAIHAPSALSDLTRVEVKHADGETERFNALVGRNPELGLALRDGDTITLDPSAPTWQDRGVWLSRESDLFLYPLVSDRDLATIPEEYGVTYPDLAEFIWAAYSNRGATLPNPDFDKITVIRGGEKIPLNWSKIGNAEIPRLQAGDIVNIPEIKEPSADWTRLADNQIQRLQKVLARDVDFQVEGGANRKIHLGPGFWQFPSEGGWRSAEPFEAPGDEEFDALGLTVPLAIRSLGYSPTDKVDVSYIYQFNKGEEYQSGGMHAPALSDPQQHKLIAEQGFEIQIFVTPKGSGGSKRVRVPSNTQRPPVPPTAAQRAAREAAARAEGRRVVLPQR